MVVELKPLPKHGRESREIKKNIEKLFDEAEKFNCSIPQKRALFFEEILADADEEFQFNNATMTPEPPIVILQRCGAHSGCCLEKGKICGPKDNEIVRLPFRIIRKYLEEGGISKQDQNYIYLNVKNHTKCHCVPSEV